jgi:hypothetical protein
LSSLLSREGPMIPTVYLRRHVQIRGWAPNPPAAVPRTADPELRYIYFAQHVAIRDHPYGMPIGYDTSQGVPVYYEHHCLKTLIHGWCQGRSSKAWGLFVCMYKTRSGGTVRRKAEVSYSPKHGRETKRFTCGSPSLINSPSIKIKKKRTVSKPLPIRREQDIFSHLLWLQAFISTQYLGIQCQVLLARALCSLCATKPSELSMEVVSILHNRAGVLYILL